jgi:hypothetical protein
VESIKVKKKIFPNQLLLSSLKRKPRKIAKFFFSKSVCSIRKDSEEKTSGDCLEEMAKNARVKGLRPTTRRRGQAKRNRKWKANRKKISFYSFFLYSRRRRSRKRRRRRENIFF